MDLSEKYYSNTIYNHSTRVAYISLLLGKYLSLDEKELFHLTNFALLHDIGAIHSDLHIEDMMIPQSKLERKHAHCTYGQNVFNHYPIPLTQEKIILFHHEHVDGSGYFGKTLNEIPLFSQIIALADYVELHNPLKTYTSQYKQELFQHLQSLAGVFFSTILLDAFFNISSTLTFWVDLENENISYALQRESLNTNILLSYDEFLHVSKFISAIVDTKSTFTQVHSQSIAYKAGLMADHLQWDDYRKKQFVIAASLHDIGKLTTPIHILEKTGKLTKEEMDCMIQHVYYTERALYKMDVRQEVINWARNHHERLDGSGYPYNLTGVNLDFESRLLAVVDSYQAMTEERPYRAPLSHENAIKVLRGMVEANKLDKDAFFLVDNVFSQHYPETSDLFSRV